MVDIVAPDRGPGEAVVKIAGTVEAVGAGVTEITPGDFVILNWRAVCGQCRTCARGKAQCFFSNHNAKQKMTLTDGTELSPALGSARSSKRPWWPPVSAPWSTRKPMPRPWACSAAV